MAQRALPYTSFVTIFAQGPSHALRSSPFLLKGPKGPPMHPVRHHFCSRAEGPSARDRRKRPIGRLSSSLRNTLKTLVVLVVIAPQLGYLTKHFFCQNVMHSQRARSRSSSKLDPTLHTDNKWLPGYVITSYCLLTHQLFLCQEGKTKFSKKVPLFNIGIATSSLFKKIYLNTSTNQKKNKTPINVMLYIWEFSDINTISS